MKYKKNYYENSIVIEWDIINFCNHNCPYCAIKYDDNKKWGSLNNLKTLFKISSIISKVKVKTMVHILGGEPTLHPAYIKIINSLLKNPLVNVTLFTNGSKLLDPRKFNRPINYVLSYHPEESFPSFFKNAEILSTNSLHENNFIQIPVLLYNYKKNKNEIINCINKLQLIFKDKSNVSIEGTFPFSPLGKYIDPNYLKVYNELKKFNIFPKNFILDGIDKNSIEIYKDGNKSESGFICWKTIYSIDIDGNIEKENGIEAINLINSPEILLDIKKVTPHFCNNTNCNITPDNIFNKERYYEKL